MSIQNDENREQRDYKNVKPKQNKRVRLAIEWGKNTFIYIVEYIKIQNTLNQRVTTNYIEKKHVKRSYKHKIQTKKNSNFKRFHRTKQKIKTVTRKLANKHL